MVTIVDYGVGNLKSVSNAFAYVGQNTLITADTAQLERADAILLPGVGAFPDAADKLRASGLDRVVETGYRLLDYLTFFTAGPMESRAWTVTRGALAPEAAGKIHTDLQRGFIRMETVSYEDLVECGSWAKAQAAGKLRIEGKDYEMQDGDVIHVRFSV